MQLVLSGVSDAVLERMEKAPCETAPLPADHHLCMPTRPWSTFNTAVSAYKHYYLTVRAVLEQHGMHVHVFSTATYLTLFSIPTLPGTPILHPYTPGTSVNAEHFGAITLLVYPQKANGNPGIVLPELSANHPPFQTSKKRVVCAQQCRSSSALRQIQLFSKIYATQIGNLLYVGRFIRALSLFQGELPPQSRFEVETIFDWQI